MAKKGTCMTSNNIGFQQTTKPDNLCACMKGLIAPFFSVIDMTEVTLWNVTHLNCSLCMHAADSQGHIHILTHPATNKDSIIE